MRRAFVVLGVVVSLLVLGPPHRASVSASAGVEALDNLGPHAIGFTSFILVDGSRAPAAGYAGRPVTVHLWYPADISEGDLSEAVYPLDLLYAPTLTTTSSEWEALGHDRAYQEPPGASGGPFPLVIVSPGWGCPAWCHNSIGTRLASHGFVVAVLFHTGDQWFPSQPAADHVAWALWNRPRDVSFVLTKLLERSATPGDLLQGMVDGRRVAASGWSLGGYASMVLAGGDDTVWDYGETDAYAIYDPPIPPDVPHTPSLPDARFRVLVPLDGSNQELHFQELSRVRVPVLGMGEEWTAAGDWQARQHAAFTGRPAYRVDVAETNHQSFSDLCDGLLLMDERGLDSVYGPAAVVYSWICEGILPPAESRAIYRRYMLAFLRVQLLGGGDAQRVLTPGWALTRESGVEFFETEKRSSQSIGDEWPGLFTYFPHQVGNAHLVAGKDAARSAPRRVLSIGR